MINKELNNLIKPETELEKKLLQDSNIIEGLEWGKPRNGHPEGKIKFHVKDVLNNINVHFENDLDRENLRIIAILHDTFKYMVDRTILRSGENHHGMIAKRFSEKYITNENILNLIIYHDHAYNAWVKGNKKGDWEIARKKADELLRILNGKGILKLYIKFMLCDNFINGKTHDCYFWFKNLADLSETF